MSIKLGHLKPVTNSERKFGSALTYYVTYVKDHTGIHPILLTRDAYNDALQRARLNSEDIPKLRKSLFQMIFGFLNNPS